MPRPSGFNVDPSATTMGTSVAQLEDTYARWLIKRTDDRLRAAFDAYDEAVNR